MPHFSAAHTTSGLGFAYLTLIATAVAYVAWFAGLRRLSPGVVGVVGLLNPVTGVVLGVVLAGEAFGMPQIVGVALVLAGIVLGAAPARQRGAPGDAPASARPPLASART